jgi:hypothetical protein
VRLGFGGDESFDGCPRLGGLVFTEELKGGRFGEPVPDRPPLLEVGEFASEAGTEFAHDFEEGGVFWSQLGGEAVTEADGDSGAGALRGDGEEEIALAVDSGESEAAVGRVVNAIDEDAGSFCVGEDAGILGAVRGSGDDEKEPCEIAGLIGASDAGDGGSGGFEGGCLGFGFPSFAEDEDGLIGEIEDEGQAARHSLIPV